MDKFICCLCGSEFEGFGNNPWPIVDFNDDGTWDKSMRCCDRCNETKVVTARLIMMMANSDDD